MPSLTSVLKGNETFSLTDPRGNSELVNLLFVRTDLSKYGK